MAVSESGVYRYVVNNSRDSHGFGCREMLKAVILANTQLGIASVRDMENLARNDIRYRLIFRNGETPSFMSFQRFIHDDLAVSVETIMTEVNKYMERVLPDDIDTKTEVIDGTKEEADFFTKSSYSLQPLFVIVCAVPHRAVKRIRYIQVSPARAQ
jgi:hypothetical protein